MRLKFTPFRAAQAPRPAWLAAAFIAVYAAVSLAAYKWTMTPGGLAVFWPNNGLVAAALLLLPRRGGLAVLAAGWAIDVLCAGLIGHAPWDHAVLIGGFDAAEATIAAVLIRNVGGAALDLTQLRRFGAVVALGILPATLFIGSAGSLLFKALYGGDLGSLWVNWAIGDLLGMSIGAPAALIIARFRRFDRPKQLSQAGSAALLFAVVAASVAPFVAPGPPLAFVLFPLFLIAAFRLTPPYAALGVVMVALIDGALTIAGAGPFVLSERLNGGLLAAGPLAEGVPVLRLQCFMASIAYTLFLAQGSLAARGRAQIRAQHARSRAEAALSELAASERRFWLLAENARDVISRSDPDGSITYVSPASREVFGYAPEELLGNRVGALVHPDDREHVNERLGDVFTPGASARHEQIELRVLTPSGEVRWIETSLCLVPIPGADTVELQCISRDITGRKALEAELEARRVEAEAASVAKSEFLANMSHEIRTPLNGVIAMADLLARSDLGAHDRRLVEIIRSSGDSLNRLLSDILDLARIEAGRVELECRPFHLGETARSVVALCSLRAQEKGVLLEVEVAAEADRHFEGDEVRVRQIVTNLVSNAVKFTAVGEVRVLVSTLPAGGVRIEVRDTGVGFDPALRDRLFDRFQQADGSITRRFGGTGLGLPISRQLAQAMGGLLQCDSTPGSGSRFWFEAPLPPADPVEAGLADAELQATGGGRVLVVDDHPTNRMVAELMLRDFGFEVALAEDGAEALAAFEAGPFDLILMDMQMPVMDGLTAVRRIRTLEAERGLDRTPVLMLTANALPEHAAQSEAAGADGHVAKPITAGALMSAIAALGEANSTAGTAAA